MRSRIFVRVSSWIEQHLASEAFERSVAATLHGKPYRTEALRDLGQLRSFLAGSGIFALFDAPWVPIFLFAVFLLHSVIGIIAAAAHCYCSCLPCCNEFGHPHTVARSQSGCNALDAACGGDGA